MNHRQDLLLISRQKQSYSKLKKSSNVSLNSLIISSNVLPSTRLTSGDVVDYDDDDDDGLVWTGHIPGWTTRLWKGQHARWRKRVCYEWMDFHSNVINALHIHPSPSPHSSFSHLLLPLNQSQNIIDVTHFGVLLYIGQDFTIKVVKYIYRATNNNNKICILSWSTAREKEPNSDTISGSRIINRRHAINNNNFLQFIWTQVSK